MALAWGGLEWSFEWSKFKGCGGPEIETRRWPIRRSFFEDLPRWTHLILQHCPHVRYPVLTTTAKYRCSFCPE